MLLLYCLQSEKLGASGYMFANLENGRHLKLYVTSGFFVWYKIIAQINSILQLLFVYDACGH